MDRGGGRGTADCADRRLQQRNRRLDKRCVWDGAGVARECPDGSFNGDGFRESAVVGASESGCDGESDGFYGAVCPAAIFIAFVFRRIGDSFGSVNLAGAFNIPSAVDVEGTGRRPNAVTVQRGRAVGIAFSVAYAANIAYAFTISVGVSLSNAATVAGERRDPAVEVSLGYRRGFGYV